ncbi:hypothetical protein D1B33_15555 [Lysinibacillus yapensis]|uniref:Uncharacterized protein n=1 Tax=Ureibacillus yapensis TaxID=2304605 RepID=A0A396SJ93_9BACL|nr:hypothetical protein D1B33_15555 [Lysinibacillus yapensis]
MAGSFLVTAQSLLPWSFSGEYPLTSIGTLTDLELRLIPSIGRKKGGTTSIRVVPFIRDGAFLCGKAEALNASNKRIRKGESTCQK